MDNSIYTLASNVARVLSIHDLTKAKNSKIDQMRQNVAYKQDFEN